jgi:hypothetical protein
MFAREDEPSANGRLAGMLLLNRPFIVYSAL